MKIAILLLGLIAVALATKTPCDIPTRFQTSMQLITTQKGCVQDYETGTVYFDYDDQVRKFICLRCYCPSYDMPRSSVQTLVETLEDKPLLALYGTIITLYVKLKIILLIILPQAMTYFLDRTTSKCYASTLKGNMTDPAIPSDAMFGGTVLIGAQAIDAWAIDVDAVNSSVMAIVTVTNPTCFPVSETVIDTTTGGEFCI